MAKLPMTMLVVVLMALARSAGAQQPPRSGDPTRTVTLALAEYNRLIDLASRPPQGPSVAPIAAVLASADLRVRVERETARGQFTLKGDVLRPGVSRVGLLSGATLVDASAAGRPIPLIAEGSAHTALLPGPAPFSLTLEWGGPLKFVPGRASFVLPVPAAGTTRATIDLPGDQADAHLSAGLITRRSTAGGRTIVEATLEPGSATEVSWSMRDSAPAAAAREVRTLADVMTLVTIADSDVRMASLVDVTVVQGEPRSLEVRLPPGYELTGVSGSSIERSEPREGSIVLAIADPAARRHQFLVSLERAHSGGSFSLDTGFPTIADVQRERGEIAVEGVGTLELTAAEREGMHRIDVRELNQNLQSLARLPLLAAFRYQRTAAALPGFPGLALEVKRFGDAGVLAAVADDASATTLVTSEGRALTEVVLHVQNRAQPFLKVTLPAGASIVSVDVSGEPAKPVLGADGTRVPLLRAGFRPNGPYEVSFVYLHAGTPFARKGDIQLALPKMDIPVGIVSWEIFVPETYSVRAIDGNVIDRRAFAELNSRNAQTAAYRAVTGGGRGSGVSHGVGVGVYVAPVVDALAGQIRGRVVDVNGAVLPGVAIDLVSGSSRRTVTTRADGTFVLSGVPSGPATVSAQLQGFASQLASVQFDQQPQQVDFVMPPGGVAESITVAGEAAKVSGTPKMVEPSQNVINLQRRAAGVLPVRVDVPRAGTSHQFVKPLVVDQAAFVNLRYKRR